MTRTEIEKVARRILGEGTDFARLGDTAIKLLCIAKVMGSASTSASETYVEEAFSRIAGSTVRRDATRLDDPNLDAAPPALDPRTASVEQLAARATAAREAFRRDAEGAYLAGDHRPEPRPAKERRGGEGGEAEAARRTMVQDAKRAWEGPAPTAKHDAASARARMLRDLEAAAGRGER